jgi:ribosome-binding factor A
MERVSELMKREVTVILQTEIDDPLTEHITITDVEVTKDLQLAKVFYSVPDDIDKENVRRALQGRAKFIRWELAKRIRIKHIPKISFREDHLEEYKQKVDELFDRLNAEREEKKGIENEQ